MTNVIQEIWMPVINFESHYEISNLGRIKSIKKKYQRVMKPGTNRGGYNYIIMYPGKLSVRVHRLVATHFIPNPENKPYINHIDGIRNNNIASNLEWCNQSENCIHSFKRGRENTTCKIIQQFDLNGNLVKEWKSTRDARKSGFPNISHALSGRDKTSMGFVWKYAK